VLPLQVFVSGLQVPVGQFASMRHCTQTSVALQNGVAPVHAVPLVDVHWTHVLLVGLHAGVGASQLMSPAQGSHLPVFGPVVMHTPLMHSGVVVQPGSPSSIPHTWTVGSQTPLAQTRVAAAAVQVPLSVGFVCGASVGIAVAFGSVGLHLPSASSHQLPAPHSASLVQVLSHAPVVVLQN
jgi:hypothetical protein